jgi:hypothetical protein
MRRNSNGFKFSLKKSGDSPPYLLRYDSKSDSEPPPFLRVSHGKIIPSVSDPDP